MVREWKILIKESLSEEKNYAFSSENVTNLTSREADPEASGCERFCLPHWQASQGVQLHRQSNGVSLPQRGSVDWDGRVISCWARTVPINYFKNSSLSWIQIEQRASAQTRVTEWDFIPAACVAKQTTLFRTQLQIFFVYVMLWYRICWC